MYKITLYDKNCVGCCSGVKLFFTEDLEEFERKWKPFAYEEQWKRYERSKAGEMVTDYYSDSPELNIVQEDKGAKMFVEKETELHDKTFHLRNRYDYPCDVYAAKANVKMQGIQFQDKYYLIGKYCLQGVCKEKEFRDGIFWDNVWAYGNPIFDHIWKQPANESSQFPIKYAKEDFAETVLETYCWVIVKELESEEELLVEQIDFEDEELFVRLMEDIPGEAG